MESLKAQLQAIQDAEKKATSGWSWFFDDAKGIICAQRGIEICRVFIPILMLLTRRVTPRLHAATMRN